MLGRIVVRFGQNALPRPIATVKPPVIATMSKVLAISGCNSILRRPNAPTGFHAHFRPQAPRSGIHTSSRLGTEKLDSRNETVERRAPTPGKHVDWIVDKLDDDVAKLNEQVKNLKWQLDGLKRKLDVECGTESVKWQLDSLKRQVDRIQQQLDGEGIGSVRRCIDWKIELAKDRIFRGFLWVVTVAAWAILIFVWVVALTQR